MNVGIYEKKFFPGKNKGCFGQREEISACSAGIFLWKPNARGLGLGEQMLGVGGGGLLWHGFGKACSRHLWECSGTGTASAVKMCSDFSARGWGLTGTVVADPHQGLGVAFRLD